MATEMDAGGQAESTGLRALVADDNKDAADSLGQLLTMWGHEVRVVYDGRAALQMAQTYQPDVALLDLGLPGMDGYQVACHIRRQSELKNIILIAVTGHEWPDAPRRSSEYGFDHHLVKPVDVDRLQALLASL